MKNRKGMIILIIVVVAVIFSIIRIYNIYMFKNIFKDISVAIDNLIEKSNFTYEVKSSSGDANNYKKKVYNKEKVALQKGNAMYYANMATNEMYVVDLENNTYMILDTSILPQVKPEVFVNAPPFYSITQINNLQVLLFLTITEEKINNVNCYKIKILGEGEAWIDKESFMPIKYIRNNVEYNYTITPNTVTEKEVTFDDIDNYIKSN